MRKECPLYGPSSLLTLATAISDRNLDFSNLSLKGLLRHPAIQ